jgi:transcriptional regulator with XRE-family HTH domain
MGTNPRPKPERLAEKLRQIRDVLGLSQSEMLRRLTLEDVVGLKRMSDYELGIREPTLMTVLQYARVAGVHMEVLVDDDLDLPDQLPGPVKHDDIKRAFASRARRRKR